ncbi:helix-turn-helix domain-containing protein [Microbacterium azadirachtae]|uniref:helix-turn-helix domain-containing protein n=1 Tax=Microbacterium azadirachtae TaxID=582680 RepID=UPI003B849A35
MPVSRSSTTPEQQEAWRQARKLVGAAVREARIQAGLTQEALALESGVTRNMLIHVEHGTRGVSFERLYDLAGALGIAPSRLLPDDPLRARSTRG